MSDNTRRISIDEREYSLTESQLSQMLEIAGRHYGKNNYVERVSSFCAGIGVATCVALLTVPKSSFQGVGAIGPDLTYGGCVLALVASIAVSLGIQFAKRLGAFGKIMSTDTVMSSLLNPEAAKVALTREENGGPRMALRADERTREIADRKPVPLLKSAPKTIARRRKDSEVVAADEIQRDEQIVTNSEIVRGAVDDFSLKLSTSQINIVRDVRVRGILAKNVIMARYPSAKTDIPYLISSGMMADAGSTVFLTSMGRLYPIEG